MPERPEHIDKRMKESLKGRMPHFFSYVKGDSPKKYRSEPYNQSTMNRLTGIIEDKPIQFKKIAGEFDYTVLLNPNISDIDRDVIAEYADLISHKRHVIGNMLGESYQKKVDHYNNYLRQKLLEVNDDVGIITNSLVVFL